MLSREVRENPVLSDRSKRHLSLLEQYSVFIILFKVVILSILMLVHTASLNDQETELATCSIVYLTPISNKSSF